MAKTNKGDPVAFLSNLAPKGSLEVDTPDGCNYDYGLAPYEGMPSGLHLGSDLPEQRAYGARSGRGKKTSVV